MPAARNSSIPIPTPPGAGGSVQPSACRRPAVGRGGPEDVNGKAHTGKAPTNGRLAGLCGVHPTSGVRARPFVKWAGGKRSLVPDLLKHLPDTIEEYWEPFVGGGALFYAIENRITRAHLSDANPELMIAYKMIQQHCDQLVEKLKAHRCRHSPRHYKVIRGKDGIEDPIERAARFIYLNKTCFNGLYRVNRSGRFNVPIGRYKNPAIVDADNLRAVSATLKEADLQRQLFDAIAPREGDLVYCDPPYDETYDQYTAHRFNSEAQQHLAKCADGWRKAGAAVIISNSDTPFIRKLYKSVHWTIHTAKAAGTINCRAEDRGDRNETIITST